MHTCNTLTPQIKGILLYIYPILSCGQGIENMVVCRAAKEVYLPSCCLYETGRTTVYAVEMPSTISTPHSKFQLNHSRRFRDMNFQKLA